MGRWAGLGKPVEGSNATLEDSVGFFFLVQGDAGTPFPSATHCVLILLHFLFSAD
jgi:hypothetical protein